MKRIVQSSDQNICFKTVYVMLCTCSFSQEVGRVAIQNIKPRPHKVYVKVNSDFDSTGYMQPRSITWKDGRIFPIEAVKDFRPASSIEHSLPGDCYTVVIKGEMKRLYFERSQDRVACHFGRWFVESTIPNS